MRQCANQGPAETVLDKVLHCWLSIYVKYKRPQFAGNKKDYLLMKDNSLQFSAGTIGKQITEIFKSAGVCPDQRVTMTSIRKMHSTSAFDLCAVLKRLVNYHMKHCKATADKNYMLQVNAERSAGAYSLLKDIRLAQDMAKEDACSLDKFEVTYLRWSEEAMFLGKSHQSSHQPTHSLHTLSGEEAGEWLNEKELAPPQEAGSSSGEPYEVAIQQ